VDAGVYCLSLQLARPRWIAVGALGARRLPSGWYVYTGSAKRNLRARLARHLRREKRCHWHIDYLRAVASVERVWVWPWAPGLECWKNALIQTLPGATVPWRGFGSSDCRCSSHLTAFATEPSVRPCGNGHRYVPVPTQRLDRDLTYRAKGRILFPIAAVRREKERP